MGADALLQTFDAKLAAIAGPDLDYNNGFRRANETERRRRRFCGNEGDLGVDGKRIVVRFDA
jgi:hypothetical protein